MLGKNISYSIPRTRRYSPDPVVQVCADPLTDQIPRLFSLHESLIGIDTAQVRKGIAFS